MAASASLAVGAALVVAPPSSAAPTCSSVSPALDEEVTCSYSGGGFTDITVPSGATRMTVTLKGAGGGAGGGNGAFGSDGGTGAQVFATVAVSSISTVRVELGAGGAGGAGDTTWRGGSGGGFSAVYEGASSAAADALVVAGGGGGGAGALSSVTSGEGGDGAAAGTAAGGPGAENTGMDNGAPGDGSGGSAGSGNSGSAWSSGGAGGSGDNDETGDGGSGYGGGGEGNNATNVRGGGGAGGSFARSTLLIGGATFSPEGGAGGTGQAGVAGLPGDSGSVSITFSDQPIDTGTTGQPVPESVFVDFTFLRADGTECSSISPQRVQVGTYVELPGIDVNCHSMPGSLVAGWTIPVAPGFTGAGSSSLPLSPGHRVRVIESQRFTLVPFDPVVTIEYDSNIADDDACTPANLAHASDNGRVGYSWVPRVDFAMARAWDQAPCTPEGYELIGWNTRGNGSGQSIEVGAPLPEGWETSSANEHRLYATWTTT